MQAGMTPNNCHQPEEKIVVAFDVKRTQIGLRLLRLYGTKLMSYQVRL